MTGNIEHSKRTGGAVIRVRFFLPVNGKTDYYFGSLKAIYEQFTPEQIGCNVETLWNSQIRDGNPKPTKYCVISRHEVVRKPQRNLKDDKL